MERYAIRFVNNGKLSASYSKEFQEGKDTENSWQSALKKAYGGGHGVCQCSGGGNKKLAVKFYDPAYGLARYANTGPDHAPGCIFHDEDPRRSGIGAYVKGVVEEQDGGVVQIKLPIGILKPSTAVGQGESVSAVTDHQSSGGRRQRAIQLLGLLHLIWQKARLNEWWTSYISTRDTNAISKVLRKAAAEIEISGASKTTLDQHLLVPASHAASLHAESNTCVAKKAAANNNRIIAIVALAAYKDEKHDQDLTQVPIKHFQGMPILSVDSELWKLACRRFSLAISGWKEGHEAIAICLANPPAKGKAEVLDIAIMQVIDWIPVESSFERMVAHKLMDDRRIFSKPLRYDADESAVFPDFILLDTVRPAPLEVFGRTDERYIQRVEKKKAYYHEVFGADGWWCWDANSDPEGAPLKNFPQKKI